MAGVAKEHERTCGGILSHYSAKVKNTRKTKGMLRSALHRVSSGATSALDAPLAPMASDPVLLIEEGDNSRARR